MEAVPSAEVMVKDNCLREEPSWELSVAITLQMSLLPQEDISTATTAAKTMKYRCSAAPKFSLWIYYTNKPEALAPIFLLQAKHTQKHWQCLSLFNPVPILHSYQSVTVCHFSHLK